jgi:predicted nucleotidyltransferase
MMERHHAQAVEAFVASYAARDEFVALLLVGSLAHGFATPASDVDVILVATEEEYRRREREQRIAFVEHDLCRYPGGYVDVKVTSRSLLHRVAERGSDAARYAYRDATILASREPDLGDLLAVVARFPIEQKVLRERRFLCQVHAWTWYMGQAESHRDPYLTAVATQKLALFACRVVLNRNEALFPYHKWLLRETARVPAQPEGFASCLRELLDRPSLAAAQRLHDAVFAFVGEAGRGLDWPGQFVADSELNWLHHEAPIDDL